ncbi:MAG: histidine--tRNA ligase [Candidatus Sulfotelmatobacter sp.]
MIKAVRGTRDLLPPETALWNFVESAVRDVFRAYNFQEIRTPIFESTELFARGVGEDTDIVSKEMYTWWDRGHSPGRVLELAWLLQHAKNYEKIEAEVKLGRGHADFVAYRHNAPPTIVEVKQKVEPKVLLQLREWQMFWEKEHGERPILALAVPEDQQDSARELAPGNLEIQVVDWPDGYEPPQSLTLRPENTAGVVRAYIEHKMWDRGLSKLYYIGPQFRRERPQKGRYRQFYQIGAEVIGPASAGSEKPLRDAEVLEMLDTLLRRLGIVDFMLYVNSIGDSKDRASYNEALRRALDPVVGSMCADCQRRAVTNPLRVFDCKVPGDQPIIHALPLISDYLSAESKEHFENVRALLRKAKVPFEVNPRLVRGLDYYTRTAFEFTHGALGAQNAILGGGRYDGLAELLGSPEPAPGIGFAIGEDRLVMALQGRDSEVLQRVDAYVAPVGEGMNRNALVLASDLRRKGLVIELGDRSLRLKKMFEAATKAGAKYILIVGENEVKADAFALKNLTTGEQVSVPRADLPRRIQE